MILIRFLIALLWNFWKWKSSR